MDQEELLADLNEKIVTIFKNFMSRTAILEELVGTGEGFLGGFYRELEMFRRHPLSEVSGIFGSIIEANYTDKLKEYVDAGCRKHEFNIQNIIKLHSCRQGLEDHLVKARGLLDELESFKDKATATIQTIIDHSLNLKFKYPDDTETLQMHSDHEDIEESAFPLDKSISLATLMTIIFSMLKLEYTMQEKVVKCLNLKTTSSELQSYCLLWGLRPYVDDEVINQAWRHVPVQKG